MCDCILLSSAMCQDIFKFSMLGERQLKEKQSVSDHKIIPCIASFKAFFYSFSLLSPLRKCSIGGFQVTSSPPCWWTVNKRSLISSLCLSTSICSFHHCYLCLPRLHENHLLASVNTTITKFKFRILIDHFSKIL